MIRQIIIKKHQKYIHVYRSMCVLHMPLWSNGERWQWSNRKYQKNYEFQNQCVSHHMFSLYLVFKIICIKQINEFERNYIEKQFLKFMHFVNRIILTIEKWEQKTHWITASNKILTVQKIKRITFSQIIVTITNKVVQNIKRITFSQNSVTITNKVDTCLPKELNNILF